MNLQRKYMLFCAILLMILPIFLSTVSSDKIMNTDWTYRHSEWIKYYLRGDLRPALEYPPLFEMMMTPFVAVNFPVKYFQVLFIILTAASMLYYLRKHESENATLMAFFMLATSITFVEYAGSLMPQGLDFVIFPFMLIFYYRGQWKTVLGLALTLSLMHSIGIIFTGTIALHALLTKNKDWKKYVLFTALVILPIFLFYFYSSSGLQNQLLQYRWDYNAQAEWDSQFLEPTMFFIYSGFLIWILMPYALYRLWKNKFKLTQTQLMYVLLTMAFVILWVGNFGVWRMISYQVVPLALLVASLISDKK